MGFPFEHGFKATVTASVGRASLSRLVDPLVSLAS
jgi:hypothetical protein